MKTFARIESDKVSELLQAKELPEFHPSLLWVECSELVAVGWRYAEGKFTPPSVDLSLVKAEKWNAIKAERDRRQLEGGVHVSVNWFLSTDRAVGEYNSLINASKELSQETVLRRGWRTMDGAEVDMTPAIASQVLLAIIAQRYAIDDAALAHKSALEACAAPSTYDFSGGWPQTFDEWKKSIQS